MSLDELKQIIKEALQQLFDRDRYLLRHGINERTIAHRFALFLEPLLPGYDVDYQYYGNIDSEKTYRLVYPEICIHRRGINVDDSLIIKIKKSTNPESGDYDLLNIEIHTTNEKKNSFPYPLESLYTLV